MFKIEVNVQGTTHGHYWLNKHSDDFIQFLPAQFTRTYGTTITKDNITAYKIDELSKDTLDTKLLIDGNELDCSETGKIKVLRKHSAGASDEQYLTRSMFDMLKDEREQMTATSTAPQTVTDLTTIQHDFGSGPEDAVLVPTGHELTLNFESLELELIGTALAQYPYDENCNFLGNN